MISKEQIKKVLGKYDKNKIQVAAIASHSALDSFDGAAEEGFKTLAVCRKDRSKVYSHYFKSKRINGMLVRGCVDEAMILDKYPDVLKHQEKLREKNTVFVPNRSFSSYIALEEIEKNFLVPLFGSRNMLKIEEREDAKHNYYNLLKQAGIPFPKQVKPEKIDRLVIVKLHHAQKKLERGFFTANTHQEYLEKSEKLLKEKIITPEALKTARVEEYIIGPVFNLNFFHSPLEEKESKIELLGIDYRFESSLDGHVRLPADQQLGLKGAQKTPEYTVCGHANATLRESLLGPAFELAETFVKAAEKHYAPGIIGPFCIQTCVDKDLNFYCYDIAVRIGGGTNVHMNQGAAYGNVLWRSNMSTGRRMAVELKRAVREERLEEILT